MKTKDVTDILKSLGWSMHTDEVGDKFAFYHLPDRTVDIVYRVRKYGLEQQFESSLTVSTTEFSAACLEIRARGGNYSPLVRAWKGLRIQVPEVLEEHVRQASAEAISWAKKQDLMEGLRKYAALPTNAPGARPIWHLAALALLGEGTKLKLYQASFAAGDRLGFVNYVTEVYIDRAVLLAEANAKQS